MRIVSVDIIRDRYRVRFDNGHDIFVGSAGLTYGNLYEGKEIGEDLLEETLHFDLRSRLTDRAANYLMRYPKSERGARTYISKLLKDPKFFQSGSVQVDQEKLIELVVEKLKEYKMLDDLRVARSYLVGRLKKRPESKMLLKKRLAEKGFDKESIESTVEELGIDDLENIRKLYKKKYKDEPFRKDDQKKVRYLASKGYSWEVISQIVEDDI